MYFVFPNLLRSYLENILFYVNQNIRGKFQITYFAEIQQKSVTGRNFKKQLLFLQFGADEIHHMIVRINESGLIRPRETTGSQKQNATFLRLLI